VTDVGPIVTDMPDRERFEIARGGDVMGFAQYRRKPGSIAFVHTEIDLAYGGQGLGTQLVAAALDAVRTEGAAVLPFCPFVRDNIGAHPEYLDLVPAERREAFGLSSGTPPAKDAPAGAPA
jgi:predicted GNAT family acetyltransferase